MRSIIRDSISLPAPAEVLYAAYLDPVIHGEITGAPVTIDAEPGSVFSAFGGAISGVTLVAIPSTLIVQAWRSTNFNAGDPDSTLILSFVAEEGGGRIELVHLDVPEVDFQGVTEGWAKYYWTPWRNYIGLKPSVSKTLRM